MVRKQIFLRREHDEALKDLAARTGKSEGALVREAIELRLKQEAQSDERWERLLRAWAKAPILPSAERFDRDSAYKERLDRYDRDPR